jgi:hypothetical protein
MAKVSLLQFTDAQAMIYNVHAAVGPGAPNRTDDVKLVQYFLRESFKGTPAFQREPFSGVVVVDGRPGPVTFAAILHFQKVTKKLGNGQAIATDGRIDPPVGEQTRGSISGTKYTIIFLNQSYKRARPQDWPRVSQAGDCPGELRMLLQEPQFV